MTTMVGLYVEFKAKSQEVDQTFKTMQAEIDKLKGKQKDISSGFGSMVGKIKEFGMSILNFGKWVALGIAAATTGLWIMINRVAESIDKVTDSARGLGLASGELQAMSYAASLSGVEFESLEMLIKKMSITLGNAVGGAADAQQAFKDLGLDLNTLKNLPISEQMNLITTSLGKIDDKTKQNSLSFTIFGKSMTDALNLARDGFGNNIAEFSKLGLAITDSQRVAVDAFGDSQQRLGAIWQGFSQKVVAYIAEPFTKMIDWISDTIAAMGGIDTAAQKFASAIVDAVRWAVNGLNSLVNIIDGLYARMLKIQIFASETNAGKNSIPDPFAIGKAVYEKVSGTTPFSESKGESMAKLPGLYSQLRDVEKGIESRKDFLKPLVDLIGTESDKIGTALTSYIEPLNSANKATQAFASSAVAATTKVNTAIQSMIDAAGQDKLKRTLGLDKPNQGSEVFDNMIKNIYTKALLGTGGISQTGMFNGQGVTNKVSTAAEDIKLLEGNIRSKYANDTGNLSEYLGAIGELKQLVSKIDPTTNRVKVDIEVKTEEGFLLKVAQSAELQKALKDKLNNISSSAARMGAK